MSYFNEEQEGYMRYLATIPAERLSWCGWYRLGECQQFHAGHEGCAAGKSAADKLAERAVQAAKEKLGANEV